MRSVAIIFLFLFSMLFLGAQAAQLGEPETAENTATPPASQVNASFVHPTSY